VRRLGCTRRVMFPPTSPYNGLVIRRRETPVYRRHLSHILSISESLAVELGRRYSEVLMCHRPELEDVRGFIWQGWDALARYTYEVPTGSLDEVLGRVTRPRRQAFSRAGEAGYQVLFGQNVDAFLPLYVGTYTRHGLQAPLQPSHVKGLFAQAREHDAGELCLTVDKSGEPVGGGIVLFDAHRAYLWLLATAPEHLKAGVSTFTVLSLLAHLAGRVPVLDHASANVPELHRSALEVGGELRLVPVTRFNRSFMLRCVHGAGSILGRETERV